MFLIFISFFPIAGLTKHLTIIGCCMSAFTPRLDVVTFHCTKIKIFFTNGAYSILPTICSQFISLVKGAQIQKSTSKWIIISTK